MTDKIDSNDSGDDTQQEYIIQIYPYEGESYEPTREENMKRFEKYIIATMGFPEK